MTDALVHLDKKKNDEIYINTLVCGGGEGGRGGVVTIKA